MYQQPAQPVFASQQRVPAPTGTVMCRYGHIMTMTTNHFSVGRGASCTLCKRRIQRGAHYYNCDKGHCSHEDCSDGEFTLNVCQACVAQGRQQRKVEQWSTGLLDCFKDPRSCLDVMLCPHIFEIHLNRAATEVIEESANEAERRKLSGSDIACGLVCCLLEPIGLWCSMFPYHTSTRITIAQRYGILPGESGDDRCTTCAISTVFCRPCSDCQIHREMTIRGDFPGGVLCFNKVPNEKLVRLMMR